MPHLIRSCFVNAAHFCTLSDRNSPYPRIPKLTLSFPYWYRHYLCSILYYAEKLKTKNVLVGRCTQAHSLCDARTEGICDSVWVCLWRQTDVFSWSLITRRNFWLRCNHNNPHTGITITWRMLAPLYVRLDNQRAKQRTRNISYLLCALSGKRPVAIRQGRPIGHTRRRLRRLHEQHQTTTAEWWVWV